MVEVQRFQNNRKTWDLPPLLQWGGGGIRICLTDQFSLFISVMEGGGRFVTRYHKGEIVNKIRKLDRNLLRKTTPIFATLFLILLYNFWFLGEIGEYSLTILIQYKLSCYFCVR